MMSQPVPASRKLPYIQVFAALVLLLTGLLLPKAAGQEPANAPENGTRPQATEPLQETLSQETQPPTQYDKAIFQKPIPGDQLAFLNHFAGAASGEVIRDKQYRKLMRNVIPDCIFHYGWDIMLPDALEKVLTGSNLPVKIRDGRYLMVSGRSGPYLAGRGFMWIDLQDGIGLGGFYFHPTNGEPTPSVTIFSRQVRQSSLRLSQLPPAFVEDLGQWSAESGVPPVTTRYFITGANIKILLEHDEDYCASGHGATPASVDQCEQMNADAADIDMNAAYYLEQTNHRTNATAWMIFGEDQVAWIRVRDDTCRVGPFRLRCRIRLTRERTHVIINRHPVPSPPHK